MSAGFKKKNTLSKIWLKISDPQRYRAYKNHLKELQQQEFVNSTQIFDVDSILEKTSGNETVRVLHSGNSGDIIYSLPTLKRLSELTGKKIDFHFKLDQPLNINPHYKHPLGNIMLNKNMAEMLTPLLCAQSYIDKALIYNNQSIDIDLDNFRRSGILVDRGDIARWCSYTTGVSPQLHLPWLSIKPDTTYSETIVIGRSERYRNPLIDYSFFSRYPDVAFVGVESEYLDIKKYIPGIKWIKVDNFKRMAEVISGSKLFIGNQSLSFSIAEGLKTRRILEVFWESPNVVPSGENGYDVMYQKHFEWLVKHLYN